MLTRPVRQFWITWPHLKKKIIKNNLKNKQTKTPPKPNSATETKTGLQVSYRFERNTIKNQVKKAIVSFYANLIFFQIPSPPAFII